VIVTRVLVVVNLPAPVDLVCSILNAAADHFPGCKVIATYDPSKLSILIDERVSDDDTDRVLT
jgi:hypothetical protein